MLSKSVFGNCEHRCDFGSASKEKSNEVILFVRYLYLMQGIPSVWVARAIDKLFSRSAVDNSADLDVTNLYVEWYALKKSKTFKQKHPIYGDLERAQLIGKKVKRKVNYYNGTIDLPSSRILAVFSPDEYVTKGTTTKKNKLGAASNFSVDDVQQAVTFAVMRAPYMALLRQKQLDDVADRD